MPARTYKIERGENGVIPAQGSQIVNRSDSVMISLMRGNMFID